MIADAHNDLLLELVLRRDEQNPFGAHWLPKLRAGGVTLQVCALYTGGGPAERLLEAFRRVFDENGDAVFQVRSREDLAVADGRIGLLLSMEGVEALGDDPADFAQFWDAGVRMVGLTHNVPNAFAGGLDTPDQGLTDRGRALVDDLAARGVVIDLAHASERTFYEILEHASAATVLVSHACCRAVHDVPRNLSDEHLTALAERDGFLGLMALALTVGGDASIERLIDHLDYALDVMGAQRVGLGTDVIDQVTESELAFGNEPLPMVVAAREAGGGRLGLVDFTGPEHFPGLVAALQARGYEGERLEGILSGNLRRILGRALPP
jgi:membrane dipeptidase